MQKSSSENWKEKLEILAPAGNKESFFVALSAGADAIYLGVNDFNARGNIENISLENLAELVGKAHLFGVKVYLTLNTLVHDSEIENVLAVVRQAISAKVDAFIVQDIGLAYLLRQKFEQIELHASTQMGIENLEGASFLSPIGFKRIVLARETPLAEIARIKKELGIDIEYFVQGALCVGYSGNCYLCSLLASASGNRGKCKQFCRLPYQAKMGNIEKQGYLLSTKDFCMLPKLKELVESGVTSLKIEGRARRPAYVGQAVTTYRKAIDNNFHFGQEDLNDLKRVFNRGDYTAGYFENTSILYPKTQNHIGLEIGKVVEVKNGNRFNEVTLKISHELIKGDSLKFFVNEKEVASVSVQDVKKVGSDKFIFTTTAKIPNNAKVSLISSKAQENQIFSMKRQIKVNGTLSCRVGKRAKLTLNSGNVFAVGESESLLEASKNSPLIKEECFSQICKLGENFVLSNLEVELDDVFMRKAELNELRRKTIALLEEKIIAKYIEIHKLNEITEKNFVFSSKREENKEKIISVDNLDKLKKICQSDKNSLIVYSPKVFNKDEIVSFANSQNRMVYLDLSVIATHEDVELYREIISSSSFIGVLANNYYALTLTDKEKTIVGSEMNVFNSLSVEFYKKQGFDKIVLSKESVDVENIVGEGVRLFVPTSVRHKLIYFKHCPIKEHFGGNCANCKYKEGVKYLLKGQGLFTLERVKSRTCQFFLRNEKLTTKESFGFGEFVEE